MILDAKVLNYLSDLAIMAATSAGEFIAEQRGEEQIVISKATGESLASQVLTEVDLKSQEIILNILSRSCKTYDLAILTEETIDGRDRLVKDYFWCIDPLDGTLPFIEGKTGYSVSIALVTKSGSPIIGVIYDPVTRTLYNAIKGQGAFKNDTQLTSRKLDYNERPLTLVCDRSFKTHSRYVETITKLNYIAQKNGYNGVEVISHGGAAMNACWVIENAPACYIKYPKPVEGGGSIWDYAATACLFKELKWVVSDIYGNPLLLNNPNTTFMNKFGIVYSSDFKIISSLLLG